MLIRDWGQWHFDGFDQVILAAFVGDTADPVRSVESLKRFEIAPPPLDGGNAGGGFRDGPRRRTPGTSCTPICEGVTSCIFLRGARFLLPSAC